MKDLIVKKISLTPLRAEEVPILLDKEGVAFQPIDNVNWSEAYPYRPDVYFRIGHTTDTVLLHFKVKEIGVRARYSIDNGSVWTDSCVEFFVIPAGDGIYYNIECNCIGTILIGAGAGRGNRERASQEVMNKVLRWASLGRKPFEERTDETDWEVALIIPYAAFYRHNIASLDRQTVKANFYKCGNELPTPHFLSWNPIRTENPNFHVPEFFGMVTFE